MCPSVPHSNHLVREKYSEFPHPLHFSSRFLFCHSFPGLGVTGVGSFSFLPNSTSLLGAFLLVSLLQLESSRPLRPWWSHLSSLAHTFYERVLSGQTFLLPRSLRQLHFEYSREKRHSGFGFFYNHCYPHFLQVIIIPGEEDFDILLGRLPKNMKDIFLGFTCHLHTLFSVSSNGVSSSVWITFSMLLFTLLIIAAFVTASLGSTRFFKALASNLAILSLPLR